MCLFWLSSLPQNGHCKRPHEHAADDLIGRRYTDSWQMAVGGIWHLNMSVTRAYFWWQWQWQ